MGIRHPLQHLRGNAIRSLKSEGVQVDVLGEDLQSKATEVVEFLNCISELVIIGEDRF